MLQKEIGRCSWVPLLVSVFMATMQCAESTSQADAIIAAWTNRISLVVLAL